MINRWLVSVRRFSRSVVSLQKMPKLLCVAEKNDAAKTISGFLSRGNSQRREGFSKFNKIYEFEMLLHGEQTKVVFTSVSGHLLGLEFSSAYRNWTGCNPEQLFEAPVVKSCPENFANIKKTLEREVRSCTGLVIWTDCDREGENIGYEIINVCRAIKPNVGVKRAKFSDMTSASIFRAMNALIAPDERVSNAVDVRIELDLRIGAAFTRFQTLRMQNVFPGTIQDLVSYGSCQIPTLGFVVQRYREIENFVAQPFWKIKLTHKIENLMVEFNWWRNRLFDQTVCRAYLMLCQADGQVKITNVQQKPKSKWRPQPMDTVELEKTGSRKLKMTAKAIMTIAEKLYTQGFISYPRTETNKFSKEMNLRSLVEMQTPHPDWGPFAARVIEWGPNPRNGNKSDNAHPPIHPTKYTTGLGGDEKRVYELVVRHFLACVSKDAVGSETVVSATIAEEEFTATGLIILERNYLDVYLYDRWTGKEIHDYRVGNTFTPTELSLHEGQTNAPSLLTEADLIGLMEKHGIGTDATHAEHIATCKDRGYIGEADRGFLVPGTLGIGLVEAYEMMRLTLAQPQLRAGLEVDLKAICDGLKDPQAVLASQLVKYKECYQTITRDAQFMDQALGNRLQQQPQVAAPAPAMAIIHELFKCPKCRQHAMIVRQKKDSSGFFISCQGYPDCKHAIWMSNDVKEISSVAEKCDKCGGTSSKVKVKFMQNARLSMVTEDPAYSRIDDQSYYITCLYCDASARSAMDISVDKVKVMGNVVGVGTQAVHQPNQARMPPPAAGNGQQNRNYGTAPNESQNRRGGWYNDGDEDDDDPPAGGGGGAIRQAGFNGRNQSSGRNNNSDAGARRNLASGWDNNNSNAGARRSQSSGWDNNAGAGRNQSSSSWNNNQNDGGSNNKAKKSNVNLNKLPNIQCKCGQAAMKILVKKDGPNQGRPFYTCATKACNLFIWADQPIPSNIVTQAGTGAKRKCGICRREGHNKNNCPERPADC